MVRDFFFDFHLLVSSFIKFFLRKEGQLAEFDVPRYESLLFDSNSFTIHTVLQMANGDGSAIDGKIIIR